MKPTSGNVVKLTLSGIDPYGKSVSQVFEYRIKNVPPPRGEMRGQNVLSMPATSILTSLFRQQFLTLISCFIYSNSVYGESTGRAALLVHGNSLDEAAGLVKNLRTGDVVSIFDIKATAQGLDGQIIKNITPIIINVQ